MKLWMKLSFVFAAVLIVGCTANFPFDPANVFEFPGDSFKSIQEDFEDFLADPLGIKPFPVVVGGDSERIYYATNLSDVRLNLNGPSNDLVIPGFYGPSNLYKYEDNQREMIRPLVPAALFGESATDGVNVVYVTYPLPGEDGAARVVACDVSWGEPWVLFDAAELDPDTFVASLKLSEGRVAFVMGTGVEGNVIIRIEDLTGGEPTRDIDAGWWWSNFDLKGNLLAYQVRPDEGSQQLFLLDLASEEEPVLLAELPPSTAFESVHITDNKVVWDEWTGITSAGVKAYDIPSGTTRTWADAVDGKLTGAADNHFLTEEYVLGNNNMTERIVIRLREVEGNERKLADFRADGLAGQSCILGDRAIFVNPDRRIVVAPLDGGDRVNFRPF